MIYSKYMEILSDGEDSFAKRERVPLVKSLLFVWVCGIVILGPLKLFHFPYNMELVDFWTLMAMPLLWLYFIMSRQTMLSWSYIIPMMLILFGSFISMFAAPSPKHSLIVVVKETYAFVWFMTLAVVISNLTGDHLRKFLIIWSCAVVLHGLVIVGQFFSPDLWRFTAGLTGRLSEYEHYRASGLFPNANSAGLFQLLGFVPLLLARFSKITALAMGFVLFLSIVITGSMGALISFFAGLLVALFAILVLNNRVLRISKHFVIVVLLISLSGGVFSFAITAQEEHKQHLEKILLGRADRSSGSRFSLWERGLEVLTDNNGFLWGVGPENFREVDGEDHQLHNDVVAFTVERGLFAVSGLVLLGVIAISRAVTLFITYSGRLGPQVVVFLGIFTAAVVESLTHQIFHTREMWLILALQEALISRMKNTKSSLKDIHDSSGTEFWHSVQGKASALNPIRSES